MQRLGSVLTLACFLSVGTAAEPFKVPKIRVPAGYTIELAAKPPLVKHPMMAGFDDQGRLYIAESAGKNLRRKDLEKELPNFIRMLEDTNKDGVFDKSTIFADKMTLPMGALWYQGALYVAAPPNIWRLEDTNGDGVADRRKILVDKFGYSGNAASVHGCFLGPAGRLYWCDGRHGHEFKDKNGKIIAKGKAARIFSCKLDGSDVQVHCGGGMDNPVEIDFTERGEMLGTANILYRQRGDCLVHWMYGGVYPRHDQSCINEFPRTGDLLLPVHNYGHIGISGMMRYRSDYLGKSFKDNVFITEFNTHKITRTRLTRAGSTFTAKVEDFLVAESNDFHPTDVLEDADGSLLVIDTGGWFRIGCPTSQIAKPNILGAIYRVRRTNAQAANDPRGLKINWSDTPKGLVQRLGDPRHSVRARAISELASRGERSLPALKAGLRSTDAKTRSNAVWTLARIDTPNAKKLIRAQLNPQQSKAAVSAVAAYSVRVNRDMQARRQLESVVANLGESTVARREAATALSVVGTAKSVPVLLNALRGKPDRVFEHAIIHALLEIGDTKQLRKALVPSHPNVARGALIAIRQISGSVLDPSHMTGLIGTDDVRLKTAVMETISSDPKWSSHVTAMVQRIAASEKIPTKLRQPIVRLLSGLSNQPKIQALVGKLLADDKTKVAVRELLLESIAESSVSALPKTWQAPLAKLLSSKSQSMVAKTISAIKSTNSREFDATLLSVFENDGFSLLIRSNALEVAAAGKGLDSKKFKFLILRLLSPSTPTIERLTAAQILATVRLTQPQLIYLAAIAREAGPLELQALLQAFANNPNDVAGEKLVSSLQASRFARLSLTQVERLFRGYSPSIQAKAKKELARKSSASQAKQAARIATLVKTLAKVKGNVANGKRVFLSKKSSCVACHRVGSVGQNIGPDLSLIGKRRNNRDLLEAVAFPSSSFARGFETHSIVLGTGRVVSGMILRRVGESVVIRTIEQKEIRIRQKDISKMLPNQTSIMPVGLERTMTEKELRDLIAYLRSLK